MSKANHYVDNEKLYQDLCEWKKVKDALEAEGKQAPRLPESVGQAIMDIVDGLAKRYNFRKYTWLEEMKGDGIERAVKAMNAFDPFRLGKQGKVNPYGFINLVVWRAFVSRIKGEKEKVRRQTMLMLDPTTETYTSDEMSGFDIDTSGTGQFLYENRV